MRRSDDPTAGGVQLALLIASVAAIAACGAPGGAGGGDGGNRLDGGAGGPNATAGANGDEGDEGGRMHERAWKVGEGGEVEVRLEEGSLELLDARPNQGWSANVEEQSADGIEVEFLREDREWRFEARVDDGRLEVQTGQMLRDAEGGTYRLGDAGAVEIRQEDDRIALVQARSTGNWGANVVRQDGEEVEVRFEREDERWRFEAGVDDGRLQVDTGRSVTEPIGR